MLWLSFQQTSNTSLLAAVILSACFLTGCEKPTPRNIPTIQTPANGKVNINHVTLNITEAKIIQKNEFTHLLTFNYTLHNEANAHISFPCIYSNTDDLIQVNLTDQDEVPLTLGRRPYDDLTLSSPRPMIIKNGDTTRSYSIPIKQEFREPGEAINLRVRFHAPSRYDELRSSIEAPTLKIPWPKNSSLTQDNQLTFLTEEDTHPTR